MYFERVFIFFHLSIYDLFISFIPFFLSCFLWVLNPSLFIMCFSYKFQDILYIISLFFYGARDGIRTHTAYRHRSLKPACLPIPPPSHKTKSKYYYSRFLEFCQRIRMMVIVLLIEERIKRTVPSILFVFNKPVFNIIKNIIISGFYWSFNTIIHY